VIGPEDEIALPHRCSRVECQGALAAVIGRPARQVAAEDALDHVVGYCVANDVSARDFESSRGHRSVGASCDTFTPLGPALVTADEVSDPQGLAIRTLVSGELVQSCSTKEMIFPIAEIIAFASALMTLEPGDVLLAAIPPGVGERRRPRRWLRDGDLVEVEVECVGRLHSYVRSERSARGRSLTF
jgi:2-keto-4-pentenoate hydratase/2-oxohepta-3-ene-1,7-dioic acid hydratase in catechol pathway